MMKRREEEATYLHTNECFLVSSDQFGSRMSFFIRKRFVLQFHRKGKITQKQVNQPAENKNMKRPISSALFSLSCTLLFVVLFSSSVNSVLAVEEGGGGLVAEQLASGNLVRCVCRCCFHSSCSYVTNASWMLDSCATCNARRCQDMILSAGTRNRISNTFRILETLEDVVDAGRRDKEQREKNGENTAAPTAEEADREVMVRHTLQTLEENKWNICEVTAMVETVTCLASATPGGCLSSADLTAVCFDRQAPVVKYSTMAFLFVIIFGVTFAMLGKNSLIGLQAWNEASFDY